MRVMLIWTMVLFWTCIEATAGDHTHKSFLGLFVELSALKCCLSICAHYPNSTYSLSHERQCYIQDTDQKWKDQCANYSCSGSCTIQFSTVASVSLGRLCSSGDMAWSFQYDVSLYALDVRLTVALILHSYGNEYTWAHHSSQNGQR